MHASECTARSKPKFQFTLLKLFGQLPPQIRCLCSLTATHQHASRATGAVKRCLISHCKYLHEYFLQICSLPLAVSCSLSEDSASNIKDQQLIKHTDSMMDLLRSLIVPPAHPNIPSDIPSRDPRLSHCTAASSGQIPSERSPLASLTEPSAHQPVQQESASASTKRKKKKKQKQKQKQTQPSPEQTKIAAATVLPTPATTTTTSAKKRKLSHLFHPDRPKGSANKRPHISYEDLYDEVSNQQPIQPTPDPQASNSNSEATQTCFFWYHGSCKRSTDRKGCQLRHALLDPPQMVVAPPRFVHPRPCELQWCAGDGPTHKGQRQKAKGGAEQKRYFEVGVSDDGSAREGADQDAGDECFLSGFEEPGDA